MAVSQSPIPELERWETQMVQFGRDHCQLLTDMDEPLDSLLDATYYDALRVYLRVAEYTGEAPWGTCADHALRIYRDRFVLPKQGQVPGYWVFPHGLSLHYQQTKDAKSREAVLLLAQNSPFTKENTNASAAQAAERSRETAYAISSLLAAEVLGAPRRPRLRLLVDHALDHIDQWFVSRTAAYVRPFMFALTAEALIAYEAQTQDRRILKAIQTGADFLWDRLWVSEAEAFRYTDRATDTGGTSPAPDLNLLIAPLFGWLGARTGQERFWERGDAIFAGGVRHAWLGRPKQYHQNYRWSFDYVQWRQAQPD